jgi:hypothetical protein
MNPIRYRIHSLALSAALLAPASLARADEADPMPHFVQRDGRHALYVDGAPFLVLGGQCNNSSAWPATLPRVWDSVAHLKANTLEAPVYWEQFEPEPGKFDTGTVDAMLEGARARGVRLVLLWFGTWKNGSAHYEPLWMKERPDLYPKAVGRNGLRFDTPSPHSRAALEADKRAFSELMRHLRKADPAHTVIMVQVENESGAWDTIRDYSKEAEALFTSPVPAALLEALGLRAKSGGDWRAVFGGDADEFFHAWSVASYVGAVAAAGKEAYALPMYANAALRDPISPGPAGTYESGGPTDNVLAIWKAAAPALDVLAPDIYQNDSEHYLRVLDLYSRADNPLFVPENGSGPLYAQMFIAALGKGAVGWAPFGIDPPTEPAGSEGSRADRLAGIAADYAMIGPMMREVARLQFEGRVQTAFEAQSPHTGSLEFGAWRAAVSYGVPRFGFGKEPKGNPEPTGRLLVACTGPDEFLVTGQDCRVDFVPADPTSTAKREYLRVEEGTFDSGQFRALRIWNGDQTDWGLNFGSAPVVLRVRLRTY